MKIDFLIILVIAVLIGSFLFYRKNKNTSDFDNTKRSDKNKPSEFIENDKIIIIKNIRIKILKKIITQFCNGYNQNNWKILPKLTIEKFQFAITFPYDVEFDTFCYFINYLKYPSNIEDPNSYKPDIKAWCKTKSNDKWMTPEISNKKIIVFIPDWDEEYDNVYLTTQDNIGFLMGFAIGDMSKKLDKPIIDYQKRPAKIKPTKFAEEINFD